MHRFHCPLLSSVVRDPGASAPPAPDGPVLLDTADDARVRLDQAQSHHAATVLRLGEGAEVELFDGEGLIGRGVIRKAGRAVDVALRQVQRMARPQPALDVAATLPKGPRADAMIPALSQLGVDRFVPLRCERSVVDPRPAKVQRFAAAAIESAKQCGRAYVMHVAAPTDLAAVLSEDHDARLIAAPGAGTPTDLPGRLTSARHVLVLIGPEGGWTDEERAAAEGAGAASWSLGPHVMRIETAACAAAAIVRYLCPPF